MSDHTKYLAEQAWQQHNDHVIMSSDVPDADERWAEHDHLVHDLQNIDDVLAQHEQRRMDDFIDACTDLFDDGDE